MLKRKGPGDLMVRSIRKAAVVWCEDKAWGGWSEQAFKVRRLGFSWRLGVRVYSLWKSEVVVASGEGCWCSGGDDNNMNGLDIRIWIRGMGTQCSYNCVWWASWWVLHVQNIACMQPERYSSYNMSNHQITTHRLPLSAACQPHLFSICYTHTHTTSLNHLE